MTSDTESPQDTPDAPETEGEQAATDRIVAAFGGIRPMAHKLGTPVTTVQGWKKRGAIPQQRHEAIRSAARDHGVELDEAALTATAPTDTPTHTPRTRSQPKPKPAAPKATPSPAQPEAAPSRTGPSRTAPSRTGPSRAATSKAAAPDPAPSGKPAPSATASTPPPPPVRQRSLLAGVAFVLALIALGATLTAPLWTSAAYRLIGLPIAGGGLASDPAQLQTIEARLDVLERRADDLASSAGPALAADLQSIANRLAALEQIATPELASRVASIGGAVDALASDIARLEGALGNQRIGLTDALALVTSLDGRTDAAETRLQEIADIQGRDGRRIDRLVASDSATQALVLAIGQLRVAVDAGHPYTQPLASLRALAAGIDETVGDLAALAPGATTGIAERDALKSGFPLMAQSVRDAVLLPQDANWWTQAVAKMRGLVTVRPVPGEVVGDDVDAILARAEARLDNGDLGGTVEAIAQLDGDAAAAATHWRRLAETRLAAEAALANLSSFAIARLANAASDR